MTLSEIMVYVAYSITRKQYEKAEQFGGSVKQIDYDGEVTECKRSYNGTGVYGN